MRGEECGENILEGFLCAMLLVAVFCQIPSHKSQSSNRLEQEYDPLPPHLVRIDLQVFYSARLGFLIAVLICLRWQVPSVIGILIGDKHIPAPHRNTRQRHRRLELFSDWRVCHSQTSICGPIAENKYLHQRLVQKNAGGVGLIVDGYIYWTMYIAIVSIWNYMCVQSFSRLPRARNFRFTPHSLLRSMNIIKFLG